VSANGHCLTPSTRCISQDARQQIHIYWRHNKMARSEKREREKKVARAASVSEGPVLESQPRDRLSDSGVRGSNQQCLQEGADWKSTKSYATNVSFRTLCCLLSTVILSFDSTQPDLIVFEIFYTIECAFIAVRSTAAVPANTGFLGESAAVLGTW